MVRMTTRSTIFASVAGVCWKIAKGVKRARIRRKAEHVADSKQAVLQYCTLPAKGHTKKERLPSQPRFLSHFSISTDPFAIRPSSPSSVSS